MKRISLDSYYQKVFSLVALSALMACGQDAGSLSEKLQKGAYTVTQYGCSGQQMVQPAQSGLILQMSFTTSEMITSQAATNLQNSNYYMNNNYLNSGSLFGNNYNYTNATTQFSEVDRDTVRYIDKETIEVVSRSTGLTDRLRVEFRNKDNNVLLTTHSSGANVSCPQGSNYIIELQR